MNHITHLWHLSSCIVVLLIILVTPVAHAAPPNDNFADSITITGPSGSVSGENIDATIEPEEPWLYENHYAGSNSVWWAWQCPVDGWYSFDTRGSMFNTVLSIYTGESQVFLYRITAGDDFAYLPLLYSFQSFVNFYAKRGYTYYIAVSGRYADEEGEISLQWYPDRINFYESTAVNTNDNTYTGCARDGSAIKIALTYYYLTRTGTNRYSIIYNREETLGILNRMTLRDRRQQTVIDTDSVPGLGCTNLHIADFNRRYLLMGTYSDLCITFHIYKVARNNLKLMGTHIVSNFVWDAYFYEKNIILVQSDMYFSRVSCQVLNKKLNKIVFEVPPLYGHIETPYINDLLTTVVYDLPLLHLTMYRKYKLRNSLSLSDDWPRYLNYRTEPRGGIIYWYSETNTNGPMTYIDHRGQVVFDGFLPEGLVDFNSCKVGKKAFLLSKSITPSSVLRSYSLKPQPELLGERVFEAGYYISAYLEKSSAYVILSGTDHTIFREYDLSLRKLKWEVEGRGSMPMYYGQGVYVLAWHEAGVTHYSIYRKNKLIAEHTFVE